MRAYVLAQQLTEEGQRMMNRLQQGAQKQRELEAKAQNIERTNARTTSTFRTHRSQNDVMALQRAQEEAERSLGAQQAQLQAAMAASQQRLNDSVMNCVRDLNAVMGYDAILFRESGVYFNPELDVTDIIITALNARMSDSSTQAAN